MDFYISKTDYKIGSSCPRKLWYKKNGYPTSNDENEYMQYLAKGGYIVGKMAQLIYDGGVDLSDISDWRLAAEKTKQLIEENENITIYEATVFSDNKLARIDILKKEGFVLNIIEVKAKSQSSDDFEEKIPKEYLDDVLFQVITAEEGFPSPKYTVKGFLFLPDKSKLNEIEGLAGWFSIEVDTKSCNELDELSARSSSSFVVPNVKFKYEDSPDKEKYLKELRQHSIMEIRDIKSLDFDGDWLPAKEMIKNAFSQLYKSVLENVEGEIGKKCKSCEYSSDDGGKNGFKECWKDFENKDLSGLDLYYGGALKHDKQFYLDTLAKGGKMSLSDIDLEVLTKGKAREKLSTRTLRQLMQIEAAKSGKEEVYTDILQFEMSEWQFPLHFIDFETFTGAIPFHKKMRPYEIIAFQWSCHTLQKDGSLEHKEWINLETEIPNFRFAESLKDAIGDAGTPLMWSHHENTVLRHILGQMDIHNYNNDSLKEWLYEMTSDSTTKRTGRLVDMARLCEKAYVHPNCKGKVSIKKILPAIWNHVGNSHLHQHPQFSSYYVIDEQGNITDPYKTLQPIKEFLDAAELEAEDVIDEGTAAMKAYFELQYGRGINNENKKKEIRELLLQYCKLDTTAMVIIYEHWKELIKANQPNTSLSTN